MKTIIHFKNGQKITIKNVKADTKERLTLYFLGGLEENKAVSIPDVKGNIVAFNYSDVLYVELKGK